MQKNESILGETHTCNYTYDTSARLSAITRDGASVATYTYDGNGNRLPGRYDDQDRMLAYGAATYTYTANGELASKTEFGTTTSYTYDELGNLTHVDLPGAAIDYLIDAQNRRVGKKVNTIVVRQWLYGNQLRIVAELDGTGALISRFVYGSRANVPDYMIRGGMTYRIISDHLGSPRLIVESTTGSAVQWIDYDAFGAVLMDTNPGFQPFGFAGGLYDPDTKLVRFGARDYDAQVGRWTTQEPLRFLSGTNLYGYTFTDPVNFADVNGENPVAIAIAISLYLLLGGPTDIANAPGPGDRIYGSDQFGQRLGGAIIAGLPPAIRSAISLVRPNPPEVTPNSCPYGSTPNGVPYTRHYGTQTGPQRNIPGSVVDETLGRVQGAPGRDGTTVYYDAENNVTVVMGRNGVVTVHKGAP